MNEKKRLLTARQIRDYAKRTWDQEFETDEAAFVDSFLHGEFHEDVPDWKSIAEKLSPSELADLFPPVARFFVATGVREGDPALPVIIAFQDALVAWRDCHLKHPVEILDPLRAFSEMIEEKATGEWGTEIKGYFEILRAGILNRMGCWVDSDRLK